MHRITLDYGAAEPLRLEVEHGVLVADCRGPAGATGPDAEKLVTAAIDAPQEGAARVDTPPLRAIVVPGDRVAVALAGDVPRAADVIRAVTAPLLAAGVEPGDLTLLLGPPLEDLAGGQTPLDAMANASGFDPVVESQSSYMAADAEGRPIHLARVLVDADVVVGVGGYRFDAALGGRALEGELWPTFSRRVCRTDVFRALARRGRLAVDGARGGNREAAWQLGLMASLRLVPGRGDSLAAACFGTPESAAREARRAAAAWRPAVPGAAALVVASLSNPRGGLPLLLRAVAAAARVTEPGGTICVASRLDAEFGPIFCRWRDGAPLDGLVREALASGDEQLIVEAFQTRFFARALGERHLVLLSDIDGDKVEELEFGHAADPAVVARLARRAPSVTVLHEADRMRPRRA